MENGPRLADFPLSEDEAERARLVDFTVDRDGELPLGTQLEWRIRGMIVRGALRPGDRVPSVRELAGFAGVNVNTARAVYGALEGEGLIHSQQGRGTFVTQTAGELAEVGAIAAEALAKARERGIDPRTLALAIYTDRGDEPAGPPLAPFPEIGTDADPRLVRDALREQIGRLEGEIASYAWHDPAMASTPRPLSEPLGRVAGIEDLERVRAELIDRLRALRSDAARRGNRQDAARTHVGQMVNDPRGHRWEVVSNEATGEPGCGETRVVPTWGPLGAIMGWWRVKVSSGCPLAAPLAAAPDDQDRRR
jgi:DNA-binding transcriptional regulator YhcF (GntR family)